MEISSVSYSQPCLLHVALFLRPARLHLDCLSAPCRCTPLLNLRPVIFRLNALFLAALRNANLYLFHCLWSYFKFTPTFSGAQLGRKIRTLCNGERETNSDLVGSRAVTSAEMWENIGCMCLGQNPAGVTLHVRVGYSGAVVCRVVDNREFIRRARKIAKSDC